MDKYVLIGIPGTGKSTIGKRAAKILRMPFYDTDIMAFERMEPEYQRRLLSFAGAEQFERRQHSVMLELAKLDKPAIIEIWPESSLIPSRAKIMKKIGTIIYIKRDVEATLAEVRKNKKRLILRGLNGNFEIDMQAEAVKLYAKESHHYEALADMTLDNNGSCDEAVNKLVAMIRGHK